jgi:hypothetical protein
VATLGTAEGFESLLYRVADTRRRAACELIGVGDRALRINLAHFSGAIQIVDLQHHRESLHALARRALPSKVEDGEPRIAARLDRQVSKSIGYFVTNQKLMPYELSPPV